jgi:protease I
MKLNENFKIRDIVLSLGCCLAVLLVVGMAPYGEAPRRPRASEQKSVQLPEPNKTGLVSVETAVDTRRNPRQFADSEKFPLSFAQIGQLAWAGQGITDKQFGLRAAHSAGEIYPLELYFVMHDGLFVYDPQGHSLKQISSLDLRKQLATAALGLGPVEDAPCDIVIAGSVRKVAVKYGSKAQNLIRLEAGYVAQNIQLQAVAMGLASVPIGDFEPRNAARVCELTNEFEPLLIICAGYPFVRQNPQEEAPSAKLVKKALLVVPTVQYADTEFIDIQRVFADAGVTCVIASSKVGALQSASGALAASEIALDNLKVEDYDAIVFIGGPGAAEYISNPVALRVVREASARGKIVAAIGSAPMILANAGVLRGMRATGQPQQSEQMKKAGAQYTGSAVERDGLIITANDSVVAVQFARAIVASLKGNQPKPEKTRKAM